MLINILKEIIMLISRKLFFSKFDALLPIFSYSLSLIVAEYDNILTNESRFFESNKNPSLFFND